MIAPIDQLQDTLAQAREELDAVIQSQNEDSDDANEDNLYRATAALDALDAAVGDLIP